MSADIVEDEETEGFVKELEILEERMDSGHICDLKPKLSRLNILGKVTTKFKFNFCLKVQHEEETEIISTLYLFHFQDQSLRLLVEK
jgi:hypothetical protein